MYKTIIFDLDDTLTDDTENVKNAFKYMMNYKNEEYTAEKFLKFREIDIKTWNDRAAGRIVTPYEEDKEKKTEWIRASRFIKFFGKENISYEEAVNLNNKYIEGMKQKVVSRDDAYEIIKYLFEKNYRIIIATNGPRIPLQTKIEKLGIKKFIDVSFASEEAGFMKPHKIYYDELLKKANITSKEEILFIGDDLEKDIKGGIEYGIDTCWCNYKDEVNNTYNCKYEIKKLNELKNIL